MNILILILLTAFDVFFFGYLNQRKKLFQKSLFKVWLWNGQALYPYYRILQWSVDILGLYLIYYFGGLYLLAFSLAAIYLGFKECLYYLMLNEKLPADNSKPYWLIRPWFIFGTIGYSEDLFRGLFFFSCLLLIISNLVLWLI